MARRSQNFEGVPNGAALTLANTASGGYPVITYRSNANSDTVGTTTGVGQGSVAAKSTAQSGVITTATMAAHGVQAEGYAVLTWVDPAVASNQLTQCRASTTRVFTSNNIAGKVKFSTNNADRYTTPNAVTVPTLLWIDVMYDVGTSTTTGKYRFCVRNLDKSFALGMTDYVEVTGQNMGGGGLPTELRAGCCGTEATIRTGQIEQMETVDSYTSAMPSAYTAPVADAGSDQTIETWGTAQLDGSSSVAGTNPITTYLWAQVATGGPSKAVSNPAIVNPTVSPPGTLTDTVFRYQLTVGDGTSTSTDTVDIISLAAMETSNVGGVETPTQWSNS